MNGIGRPWTRPGGFASARMFESYFGRLTLVPCCLLGLVLASPLEGQEVRGQLLEVSTERPIRSGLVALVTIDGEEVDQAETDSLGRFLLSSGGPGSFYVRAKRLGYRTKMDGILELGEGGRISIEFYLMPDPIEVEGVEGTAERMDRLEAIDREYLEWQGFYERMDRGFGYFMTPEDLEERVSFDAWDLFHRVPGLGVSRPPRPTVSVCAVYLDGILIHEARDGPWRMSDDISVEAIAGIEIYTRGTQVPVRYSLGGCGRVILVWSKG